MKKYFKSILILHIFLICLCGSVYAKEGIESIDINIYINQFGDADVKEIWKCEAYSGTEWYHPYYNLGNAKITNLIVSENNKKYNLLSPWNVNATQYLKKDKYGIINLSDGIEICWGMGDYGVHEYEISYTIKNFVDDLNDSQMIYWTLIPHNRSDEVNNASIKIYSDKIFDANVDLWGFGEEGGICRVYDGYIEMKSNNGLKTSEYMTILAKFPENFFYSSNKINKNFEYYYNMAIKGTKLEVQNKKDYIHISNLLFIVGTMIVFYVVLYVVVRVEIANAISKLKQNYLIYLIAVILLVASMTNSLKVLVFAYVVIVVGAIIVNKNIKEDKIIKGKIKESQVPYYTDIPCEKDLFKVYYIAYQYGIIKNESNLLGAVILKWIREKKAIIVDKNSDKKKEDIQLIGEYYFSFNSNWANPYEHQLYQMMYIASGEDGILEKKELRKWCKNNYSNIFTWLKNVMQYEQNELIKEGKLILEKRGKKSKYIATENLYNEGKRICGFKKYLKDFTLVNECDVTQTQFFDDYLIIAQIFGIADEVSEKFEEIYPNMVINYNDYLFAKSASNYTIRRARKAGKFKTFRASIAGGGIGGGGHSFGGGGGGSHGHSSRGGGGRR